MRALLDVNVLVALFDATHVFHDRAHNWWSANSPSGWASSPITEHGVVRIMGHPAYSPSRRFSPRELTEALRAFVSDSDHEFWSDGVTIRDAKLFAADRIHGARQLTGVYLLGLAWRHGGRMVTFDRSIPLSAVVGANPSNLCVI
jgi:uncharacterized protein